MELAVQLLVNGVVAGSVYGLMAAGFALIFGAARHFHIAHAGIFSSGGYVAFIANTTFGLPALLAVIVGLAFGVLLGVVLVWFLYRPLERRGGTGFILFLVSLGVLMIVDNIFALGLGARPARLGIGAWFGQPVHFGAWSVTAGQIALVVVTALLLSGILMVLHWTLAGKLVQAYSSNPELVEIIGQRPGRVLVLVYAVGSLFAAVAGVYVAGDTGMRPGLGETFFILAIMAVFVGGIGSVGGAFAAAMALGILQNMLLLVMDSEWTLAVIFAGFLILMTVSPQGLASLRLTPGRRLA